MKTLLFVSMVAVATVSLSAQAPSPPAPATPPAAQGPTFRAGVELITVDVSVVDASGRPVEDLRAPDFAVQVDGMTRRVVSAELVKFDVDAARRAIVANAESHFTSNVTAPQGRLIVIAVDQLGIGFGRARAVMQAAATFLDSLTPADRVALVAYPAPGTYVDFTNDHAALRAAMARVTGTQRRPVSPKNIGLFEAIQIVEESNGEILETVVDRECRNTSGIQRDICERDVVADAGSMVSGTRQATIESLKGLGNLLQQLTVLPGPKSVILLSEGMVLADQTQLTPIVQQAARANASINVLVMEPPRGDINSTQMRPTATEDRDMQLDGLRTLAADARGGLFTVVGTGQTVFQRLSSELAAYYVLGVEEAAGDRDAGTHRIDVEVRRNNVSVRSRRAFVMSSPGAARRLEPREALIEVLKSPFGVADLPLRVATFARQDASGEKVRLVLAADVGQPGMAAQEFDVGYALIDVNGTVVASAGSRRALAPVSSSPAAALEYLDEVVVDPGVYTLRLAVVDAEGRRGGVVREVNAWKLAGEEFALGDLMIGDVPDPAAARGVRPAVEPRVTTGLGAYIEFYSTSSAALDEAAVTIEIARAEDGPALVSGQARVGPGERPSGRMAAAVISTRLLPPGRYVARARVTRNGATAGVLARPFVLDGAAAAPNATASTAPAAPVLVIRNVQAFDAKQVLGRDTMAPMLEALATASPGLGDALMEARAGRYSVAAVEALAAGDQTAAAFLKGLDWFTRGAMEEAVQQLEIAAGPRREFFPAAFYLGASLAALGRDREAAGVWQQALGTEARPSLAYVLFADARFRDQQPASVIAILKPAYDRAPADAAIASRLATAYLATEQYAQAIPVLDAYLARSPADQSMLFAAVFAQYQVSSRNPVPLSTADLDKLARYVRAFRGAEAPLLQRYLESIRGN